MTKGNSIGAKAYKVALDALCSTVTNRQSRHSLAKLFGAIAIRYTKFGLKGDTITTGLSRYGVIKSLGPKKCKSRVYNQLAVLEQVGLLVIDDQGNVNVKLNPKPYIIVAARAEQPEQPAPARATVDPAVRRDAVARIIEAGRAEMYKVRDANKTRYSDSFLSALDYYNTNCKSMAAAWFEQHGHSALTMTRELTETWMSKHASSILEGAVHA